MPRIINRLPVDSRAVRIAVASGGIVELRPYQVLVWVSLSEKGNQFFASQTFRFPAIVDTGYNDNFAIRAEDFSRLSGFDPRLFTKLTESKRSSRGNVHRRAANIWLHSNLSGTREFDSNARRMAYLELSNGIQVFERQPEGADQRPSLPLLGMKALFWNKLRFIVDGRQESATITTTGWPSWI